MFNWIKKLFVVKTRREYGQAFAYRYLQKGYSYEELEALANGAFDFDDFDRGILDVVRNRGMAKEE